MAKAIDGYMRYGAAGGDIEVRFSSGSGPVQNQNGPWMEQHERMDQFSRQARDMFVSNGGRGINLPTLATALNTDEVTTENVLDRFGHNMMQKGEGRCAEFNHWDALPLREKISYFAGRGPWSVRKVEI